VAAGTEPETDKGVLPDPGNLKAYEQRIGETFSFSVTGAAAGGSIWGTDIYTTDSRLNTAAVHAGVLKDGETGIVKVKIVAAQASYAGSARNGVTSSGYGNYGGSYEIVKAGVGRPGGKFRGPRRLMPK
jgi:LCCL domain-containing protein